MFMRYTASSSVSLSVSRLTFGVVSGVGGFVFLLRDTLAVGWMPDVVGVCCGRSMRDGQV